MSIGDDGIVDGAVGGPVIDHDTGSGAYADPAWAPGTKLPIESAALATLGQGDPMTRQMMTVEPSQQGPGVVDTAVQQALRAAEEVRVREALTTKGINGYGFVPTKDDYNLLARAIFAEGRGTPKDMEALAYAIVNRVRPRNSLRQGRELSPTLRGVLSAPPQFSFWPNARQPQGSESWVLSAHPERMNAIDRASWEAAVQAAERALSGLKPDPTGHSSFFFASRDYDGNPRNSAAAPGDFYKRGIANGSLIPSPYRSPYPPGGYPWAHYFFEYEGDRGPPKR